MWTTFKVFIELVTYNIASVLGFGFFRPWGTCDLSSLTRDQTHNPCSGRPSLNHRTPRKSPQVYNLESGWPEPGGHCPGGVCLCLVSDAWQLNSSSRGEAGQRGEVNGFKEGEWTGCGDSWMQAVGQKENDTWLLAWSARRTAEQLTKAENTDKGQDAGNDRGSVSNLLTLRRFWDK